MPNPDRSQHIGGQYQPRDVGDGPCASNDPVDQTEGPPGHCDTLRTLTAEANPAIRTPAVNRTSPARQVLAPMTAAQVASPQAVNSARGIVNANAARSIHPAHKIKVVLKLHRPSPNQENQRPPMALKPLVHRRRRGIQKARSLASTHKACGAGCGAGCGGARGRFTPGKLHAGVRPPRAAARDGSIAREDAMLSIARGVQHVQSCNGCDRPLCQSTRTLVRRCAHHVRQCSLLSCRDCQACNVSRMVQIAWQSGNESDRVGICAKGF